ncbi:MAG: class I SAM-dependent methyltransferase [Cyclobacteriaceae bacterium]|nr:class I SAM-dependent methyltransferase [Cyclobacteriaceae bacterium]
MSVYTTEIASDELTSDNPIHQRLLKAYYVAEELVGGSLLEIGCGEGRGVELLAPKVKSYTAVDKIEEVVENLSAKYPKSSFIQANIPPLPFEDNSFDTIISFQVIEHIKDDSTYLEEINRILKPGGKAYISTPNIKMTLSRNPWHIREYTAQELTTLCENHFKLVEMKGIEGNGKVMEYYEQNKTSVNKIMRFDIFNLQHHLPASVLKVPYEILNRRNRNKLQATDDSLVATIHHSDYLLSDEPDNSLDLFAVLTK